MLYSRKIVLAIAACVVAVSASQTQESEAVKAANAVVKSAKKALDEKRAAYEKINQARQAASQELYQTTRDDKKHNEYGVLKAKLDEQTQLKKKAELVMRVAEATHQHAIAKAELLQSDPKQHEISKKNLHNAALELDYHVANNALASAKGDALAMAAAKLKATKYRLIKSQETSGSRPGSWDSANQAELDQHEAVLTALEAAEAAKVAKVNADAAAAAQKLADDKAIAATQAELTATKRELKPLAAAKAAADADAAKSYFQKTKDFFMTPVTKYRDARSETVKVDGQETAGDLGFFKSILHALWPHGTGGKATYIGAGLAAAAGVGGGAYLYGKHKDQVASDRKTKWALGAGLLAATGAAAVGGKYAYDQYQNKQQLGESDYEVDQDDDASQSQTATVSESGKAGSKPKTSKATGSKKSNWMMWTAAIVLGLAVIGGAVYYFLFMGEGSEEDAIPEGMDQV